jgi:TP901 family phage tail tape measure protein
MADPASGGDEIKRIILRAEALNFSGAQKEVLALNQALKELSKTLSSGQTLSKGQISNLNSELSKLEKTASSAGAGGKKSLDSMNQSAKQLQDTLKMTASMKGINITGDKKVDDKALRNYQKSMQGLGVTIVGSNPHFAVMARNIKTANEALKSGTNAGYANAKAIDAIRTGAPAALHHVSSMDRFRVSIGIARKGLEGMSAQMKANAKEAQWTGRQMIEGLTVPILGVGVAALRTFDSINKEMVQLKKVTEYKEDYAALEKQMQATAIAYGMTLKSTATLFTDVAALGKSGDEIAKWSDAIAQVSMVGGIDPKGATEFFRVINAIFAGGSVQGTTKIMAQLSAVSDETSLQLKDLAAAFPEVAPVMAQMGFTAAGVAASLAGMYRRGIPATEAAHGLKFALQRLVAPTKDAKTIIDELGFSFADATGKVNMGEGTLRVMKLADQLASLSDAQKLEVAPELFGGRQSARMNSYFADIRLGNQELIALQNQIITVDKVQSDFLRGLIASGEIQIPGVQSAASRYDKALKQIQKDPSTAIARIKTQFQILTYEIGKTVAPAFISVSESLIKVLNLFMASPPAFQKFVIGAAAVVAAIGPIRYVFAQMKYTVASFTEVFAKLLPRFREISEGAVGAARMLAANPLRQDIVMVGDKYQMLSNIGWVNKLRMRLGMLPKANGEVIKTTDKLRDSMKNLIFGASKLTAEDQALVSANGEVAASNATRTVSEEAVQAANTATATSTRTVIIADEARAASVNMVVGANARIVESNATVIASNLATAASNAAASGTGVAGAGASAVSSAMGALGAGAKLPKALPAGAAAPKALTAGTTAAAASIAALSDAQKKALATAQKLMNYSKSSSFDDSAAYAKKAADIMRQNGLSTQLIGVTDNITKATTKAAVSQGMFGKMTALVSGPLSKMKALMPGSSAGLKAITAGAGGAGGALVPLGSQALATTGSVAAIAPAAAGAGGALAGIAAAGPIILAVLAALAVAMGVIVIAVKMFKDHWNEMKKIIEPSVKKLSAAFGNLKDAFMKIFSSAGKLLGIFSKVFDQLGSGGDTASSTAMGVANGIAIAIDFVAEFVNAIAEMVSFVVDVLYNMLKPAFEYIAYIIKDVVGLVVSLIKGDFIKAFQFAGAFVYEVFVRNSVYALQILVKVTAWAVGYIISLLGSLANVFGSNFIGNGLKKAGDSVNKWASSFNIVGALDKKMRTGLGGVFGASTKSAAAESTPAAEEAGGEIGAAVSSGIGSSLADGGAGSGQDWFKDWLSQIKGALDKQMGDLRSSATAALEKAHDTAMQIYDQRVKAIENQEKAEEKLLKAEEYIAKRKELLQKREVDRQNYVNNRAKAIYEGRINDVRILDAEERQSKEESNNAIGDLDSSRNKDLLKESRDAAKDAIKIEKDLAEERYKIQRESFDDMLELITQYAPQSVEGFDNMLTQISSLLKANGVDVWPEMAKTGITRFQDAFDRASGQIRDDFFWSGKDARAEWMRGFAPEDVVAILQANLSSGGGGGGAGGGLGLGGGEMEPLPLPDADTGGLADGITKPIKVAFRGAVQFIKDNWTAAIGGIIGGFVGGPLGAAIGMIIGYIVKKIFDFITSYDWGTLLGTIWDVIWGAVEGAIKGVGKIGSIIGEFFAGIDYAGIGSGILNGLVSTLRFVLVTVPTKIAGFLANSASVLWDWIKVAVPQIPYWVGYALGFVIRSVITFIPNLINIMKTAIPALVGWIADAAGWVGEKIGAFASAVWSYIPDFIKGIPGHIADAAIAIWGWISTAVSMAAGKIAEFSVAAFNGIMTFISNIPGWVAGAAAAMLSWLVESIKNLPENFVNLSTAVANGFITFVSNIPGWIAGAAEAVWSWLKSAVGLAGEKISEFWQGFRDGLGDIDEKIVDIVKEWAPKLWDWVTDAISGLGTKLAEFATAILNFLVQLPGKIASKALDLAESLIGWVKETIPKIPYYMGFFLGTLIRLILEMPGKIVNTFTTVIPAMWGWLKEAGSMAIGKFKEFGLSALAGILIFITGIPGAIAGAAIAIWDWLPSPSVILIKMNDFGLVVRDGITTFIGNIPGWVAGGADAIWDWLFEAVPKAVEKWIAFNLAVLNGITTFISNIPGWVAGAAESIWDWLKVAIPKAAEKIAEFGQAVYDGILTFITNIPGWVAGAADAIWDWLFQAVPLAAAKWVEFNLAVMNGIITFITNIPGWVADAAGAMWGWMKSAVGLAGEKLGEFWQGFKDGMGDMPQKIEDMAKKWIPKLWEWLSGAARGLWDKWWEFQEKLYGFIIDVGTALPGKVAEWAGVLLGWITGAADTLWDTWWGFQEKLYGFIADVATELPGKVAEWIPALWNWLTDAAGGLWDKWWEFQEKLYGFIGNVATGIWDKIWNEWIPSFWNWIVEAKNGISTRIGGIWDTIWGFITDLPGRISGAASGMWDGIGDAFKGALNKVIGWWNNFSLEAKIPSNWFTDSIGIGGKTFGVDTPNIDYLAKGGKMYGTGMSGIVDKSMYVVGEGKKNFPEFVIPTDPSYRGRAQMLLAQAASTIGSKAAVANGAANRTSYITPAASGGVSSGGYAGGGAEINICVDTFIGEEQWFAEMAKKYNMTVVPKERKVAGQQRRVVSSYNNRWDIK